MYGRAWVATDSFDLCTLLAQCKKMTQITLVIIIVNQ